MLQLINYMFSVQFSHPSCLTVCNPTDCSMPGFPVHHQLLELAQTHVHQVGDAMIKLYGGFQNGTRQYCVHVVE